MTGNSRRWLPMAVAVLAIAAMAVGARRDGPLDAGASTGVWANVRPIAALATVIALAVVATNFAKHRDDGYGLLHRAGTATAVLLSVAAVLTPIGLLFFGRKSGPRPLEQPSPLVTGSPHGHSLPGMGSQATAGHGGRSYADWIVLSMLSLIAATAFALLVYALIRFLSRLWTARQPVPLLEFDPLAPEFDEIAEAVAAGTEALEYEGDAREAVIACYSAMESAVSAGGGGRRPTDTPDEFLRRATSANLIPEEPARRLTELFREARFSRHRIGEEKRDAAREALRAISVHLQGRAAELAAASAARAGESGTSAPADGRA